MKQKKRDYRLLNTVIIFLVVLSLLLGFLAYKNLKNLLNMSGTPAMKNSISEMDYHLRANATSLQESKFKELEDEFYSEERDDKKVASLIVENFVLDFYTWTNKYGQYDVGGLYYVYSPLKINIYNEARYGFYENINNYIDEYGQNGTLEVNKVSSSCTKLEGGYDLEMEGSTRHYEEAYYVNCDFGFKNTKMDTSSIDNSQKFTVIKNEDGRFEIVEAYGE